MSLHFSQKDTMRVLKHAQRNPNPTRVLRLSVESNIFLAFVAQCAFKKYDPAYHTTHWRRKPVANNGHKANMLDSHMQRRRPIGRKVEQATTTNTLAMWFYCKISLCSSAFVVN